MTEKDQENEKTNALNNELLLGRNTRNYSDFNLFDVMDRDYKGGLNLPEGKDTKSSFSRLTYVIGAAIFLIGVTEGSVAAQFTKFRSLNELQLYGLVLLTAFVSGMVFIGFGKAIELIIFRSDK